MRLEERDIIPQGQLDNLNGNGTFLRNCHNFIQTPCYLPFVVFCTGVEGPGLERYLESNDIYC